MTRKTRAGKRIGDVAKLSGVHVETIRFYERKGLIDQPDKPFRGWREYGERQVAQLSYVKLAQRLGLSLSDVRALKTFANGPRAMFCRDVRRILQERLAELAREIATLQSKHENLAGWLVQCEARGQSKDCPLYSQLQTVAVKSGRTKP